MSEIERSTRKTRDAPAWAGTIEELRRLGEVIETQFNARRKELLAESDSRKPSPGKPTKIALSHDEFFEIPLIPTSEELAWQTERSRIENIAVKMTYSERDNTVTASIGQVFQELDRRAVESVKFSAGSTHTEGVELEMKCRVLVDPGVTLRVASPDRGWANQTFVLLSDEIDKGVPRWAWVRRAAARGIITLGTALVLSITIGLIIWPYVPAKDEPVLVGPLILLTGVLWVTFVVSMRLYNWVFPAFEITVPGGGSSGSRRIAYVVSLVISVVIGILVNRIS